MLFLLNHNCIWPAGIDSCVTLVHCGVSLKTEPTYQEAQYVIVDLDGPVNGIDSWQLFNGPKNEHDPFVNWIFKSSGFCNN